MVIYIRGGDFIGKVKDISGMTFGNWVVLKEFGRNSSGGATFLCRCACGVEKVVTGYSIRSGASTNCGHIRRENVIKQSKLVTTKHGGKKERLYGVWMGMRDRCNNPNSKFYHRYGGRGIKVCDNWNSSYENFRDWAMKTGYDPTLPKGCCTLERRNNDGDYSPDNCVWATAKEQCNNRCSNHTVELDGETHTLSEWADITGIRKDTLRRRICVYGWSIERALTEPVRLRNN